MDAETTDKLNTLKALRTEAVEHLIEDMKNGCECEPIELEIKLFQQRINYIEFTGKDYVPEIEPAEMKAILTSDNYASSLNTATLSADYDHYVFKGSTGTWTWGLSVAESSNKPRYIKNRGTGNLIILSKTGTNDFYYLSGTTNSLTILPGNAIVLYGDGEVINVE